MPAIDIFPPVLVSTAGVAAATTKETATSGDAFERAMTDALAPVGKKSEETPKAKPGSLASAKRPPVPAEPTLSAAKNAAPAPGVSAATAFTGETKKTVATSTKAAKADEASPTPLIPPIEIVPPPMMAFPVPTNFNVSPPPAPASGGKSAASPTGAALAGGLAKTPANPLVTAQTVSPEMTTSSSVTPAADLLAALGAPTSNISQAAPGSAPAIRPTTASVTPPAQATIPAPQGNSPALAALTQTQSILDPIRAAAQTLAPASPMLASDGAVALPTDFPVVTAKAAVGTPDTVTRPLVAGNDPQAIPILTPAGAVLPTVAGKLEPAGANRDVSVSANVVNHPQPGKNPAGIFISPAADQSVPADVVPASSMYSAAAPTPDAVALPGPLLVRNEPLAEDSGAAAAAVANTGTGVASTLPTMKKSDKVEFFAGSTGQKLPVGGPTRAATGAFATVLSDLPPRRSEMFSADYAPFTGGGSDNNVATTLSAPPVSLAALPSLAEARLQTVERTHDLVSAHALRLVESNADSMSVVLKPGGGTELSLELRQRNGVVEAQAYLSQGDHQFLNQHWADLQSRLELRGVKLGPLGGEDSFTSGGNFSQQQAPSRDEETERAAAFAEFAAVSGGATARSATGTSGWESWA